MLKLQPERKSGNSFTCQAGNPPCPHRETDLEGDFYIDAGRYERGPPPYKFYSSGKNRFSCVECK